MRGRSASAAGRDRYLLDPDSSSAQGPHRHATATVNRFPDRSGPGGLSDPHRLDRARHSRSGSVISWPSAVSTHPWPTTRATRAAKGQPALLPWPARVISASADGSGFFGGVSLHPVPWSSRSPTHRAGRTAGSWSRTRVTARLWGRSTQDTQAVANASMYGADLPGHCRQCRERRPASARQLDSDSL
jgi:hypothetical protein